jgi:hypothetical protein
LECLVTRGADPLGVSAREFVLSSLDIEFSQGNSQEFIAPVPVNDAPTGGEHPTWKPR